MVNRAFTTMNNTQLKRRTFVSLTALSVLTVAAPILRAQSQLEKTRISISVGGKAVFYYLPLTIAEQLGYFDSEGLKVEVNDWGDGARALQAVVDGSANVVSGAYEHTIKLQSRGQDFQAFVMQGRAPAIVLGISSKTIPNFSSVADLKGKRIGISGLGSSTHMVVKLILARAGLKEDEVNFIGVGTTVGALTAFRTGQIDALCGVDPVVTLLEQKGEIRIIADTRTLTGTVKVFGGAMPAGCLYAPLAFVKKNPNTVQALTNAIVHSLKRLQTAGPGDIIKTVPESYLLGDRALYLAAFNKMREAIATDGLLSAEGPRTAVRVLASLDPAIKLDKMNLGKTYTNEFAKKAKERFKA